MTPTQETQDKTVTVDVPEDRIAEFYAVYARFLAGERRGRGRRGGPGGRGRHGRPEGHGPHGRCHHGRHEDAEHAPRGHGEAEHGDA